MHEHVNDYQPDFPQSTHLAGTKEGASMQKKMSKALASSFSKLCAKFHHAKLSQICDGKDGKNPPHPVSFNMRNNERGVKASTESHASPARNIILYALQGRDLIVPIFSFDPTGHG
jgi:hypothetical protein